MMLLSEQCSRCVPSIPFADGALLGLCHNDLHGGNLLVDSQGLVWLIDFATVSLKQLASNTIGIGCTCGW